MNYKHIIAVSNTGDDSISVIDPRNFHEIRRIQLPIDSGPYGIIKYGTRYNVLVSQYYADSLISVDLLKGEVLDSFVIGRRPWYMAYDNERDLAFVTNSDSDTISVVCTHRMKLISQTRVGSMPQGIDFDPVSRTLAIANVNSNDVMIIDADDFSVKKHIKLNQNPLQVKYSADGEILYISCSSSHDSDKGSIKLFDTRNYNVSTEFRLKAIPGQIYDTRDGKYILVASMGKGGLEIVHIDNGKTIKRVSTNGMTHGMAMDQQEKHVYVTNPDDNSISAVDWKKGEKITTVEVGKEPNGIVFI